MEASNKKCYACRHLQRYYTKGNIQYNKTDVGWCRVKSECINVKDSCDKFTYRAKHIVIRRGIQRYLNDILLQLSSIRSIIEEESNDPSEE